MRVAYVCMDRGIPVFGRKGASVHVQGVVSALRRAGHDVEVFAARLGDDRAAWLSDVVVHLIEPQAGTAQDPPQWSAAANAALSSSLAASGAFDLVYERYSLWSNAGMEYARCQGIPGILEVNAPLIDEQCLHRQLVDRAGAESSEVRAFAAASCVVAVSEEVASYVKRHVGLDTDTVVEPNGFDPARFPEIAGDAEGPFTLGFLGTLKPWHGLGVLADTFAHVARSVPNAELIVVGDGPERDTLRVQLNASGLLQRTTFAGAVAPEQVGGWLARMHVALAPYPATGPFYFSPLKVVEYMAAGLPVVASASGQIQQLVRHGQTGLLATPGDAAAFAGACVLLHNAVDLRRSLGLAARADAFDRRTWDAVVGRILARALQMSSSGASA